MSYMVEQKIRGKIYVYKATSSSKTGNIARRKKNRKSKKDIKISRSKSQGVGKTTGQGAGHLLTQG
jgi:hypothetical protein